MRKPQNRPQKRLATSSPRRRGARRSRLVMGRLCAAEPPQRGICTWTTPVLRETSRRSPTTRLQASFQPHKKHTGALVRGALDAQSRVNLRCEQKTNGWRNEAALSYASARLYRTTTLSARLPHSKPLRIASGAKSARNFSNETELVRAIRPLHIAP